MKYIRTEDGVFELVDTYYMYVDGVETYMYKDNGIGVEINSKKIITKSDTIEELCDIFYWDCEGGFNIHNFMNYPIAKDTWDEYVSDCFMDEEKPDRNMYGCIKTSKGLIYVAKMNSKGELELL